MKAEEISRVVDRYVNPEIFWYMEIMDAKERGEDTTILEKRLEKWLDDNG